MICFLKHNYSNVERQNKYKRLKYRKISKKIIVNLIMLLK